MKQCPKCSHENADYTRFCVRCGEAFSDVSKAPSEAAETLGAPQQFPSSQPSSSPETPASVPSVLIENDMPFNKQVLKDLYAPLKNLSICSLVCGAVVLFLTLVLLRFQPLDLTLLWAGIILLALGIFYLLYFKKLIKGYKLVTETTRQLYRFDENGFQIIERDERGQFGNTYRTYSQITKVRQRKHYILLYFGPLVFPVNVMCFTYGTENDLKNLLQQKCPPKAVRFPKK